MFTSYKFSFVGKKISSHDKRINAAVEIIPNKITGFKAIDLVGCHGTFNTQLENHLFQLVFH